MKAHIYIIITMQQIPPSGLRKGQVNWVWIVVKMMKKIVNQETIAQLNDVRRLCSELDDNKTESMNWKMKFRRSESNR